MDVEIPDPVRRAKKRKLSNEPQDTGESRIRRPRKGKRGAPRTIRATVAKQLRLKLKQAKAEKFRTNKRLRSLIFKYKRQLRQLYPNLYGRRTRDVEDI